MDQLWELARGGGNDFSMYIYANDADGKSGTFRTDGTSKHWANRPSVKEFLDKNKKKQKPIPDIGWLTPGSMILNEKAYIALKDFLSRFGEMLELDCDGDTRYFYNITNLISCIDFEKSEKIETAVIKAAFLPEAIPKDAQIFKDPRTAHVRIYLTQAAKDILEGIISAHQLSGLKFFEAGKKF